ncbi:MAG: ribonucleotide reductase N-terminal alpha domain-containing protein [Halioglobus sp.]
MRVAMGLAAREEDRNARAIEFYQLPSSFDYMSSTPTLFNAGTLRPQLSSCYLTTVADNLYDIYGAIQDNAMLSKFAGGLGKRPDLMRAAKSHQGHQWQVPGRGPVPQSSQRYGGGGEPAGERKGAVCAYPKPGTSTSRSSVELRKNTGDDRRRTHDMNTANWIPDLFMKRCSTEERTPFSPQ